MSDSQRTTRRTSARLADKEDHPTSNGGGSVQEKGRGNTVNGGSSTQVKISGGGARGKRKKEMEEEDDGFQFTRTRKKTKAEPVIQPAAPIIEEAPTEASKPVPARKSRKKSIGLEPPVAVAETENVEAARRRSPRLSGDSVAGELPPLEVKKKRSKENGVKKSRPGRSDDVKVADATHENVSVVGSRAPLQAIPTSRDVMTISLPFADTPIIRRNKEMRRGASDSQRRSSLGLRGRRASSLINSGKSNALPHDGVDSAEFYKHVESNGLPEPHRMKQILIWCGTRALQEKPSFAAEDSNAKLAAREIQQQLLKDIVAKSELSNWFDRETTAPPPKTPEPNPKNISNLAQIQKVEEKIARLQAEREQWEALLQAPQDTPSIPSYPTELSSTLQDISSEHLSESQAKILKSLQSLHIPKEPGLAQITHQRIEQVTSHIEFDVDSFAENSHIIEQFQQSAEKVADDILAISAQALEERDRRGREGDGVGDRVGMREVLRGLSRVIDR